MASEDKQGMTHDLGACSLMKVVKIKQYFMIQWNTYYNRGIAERAYSRSDWFGHGLGQRCGHDVSLKDVIFEGQVGQIWIVQAKLTGW